MKLNGLRWRSLSSRVTLFMLAIFLTSIWSLTVYVSQKLRADMERLLGEQQFSTVTLVASSINAELQNRIQALTLVAGGIDLPLMKNQIALQQYLKERILLHPMFNAGVHIVGVDGVALADVSSIPSRIGTDFSYNDSIRLALSQGKSNIGRPLMGPLLKQPVFPVVVPIFGTQGQVIGAIAGTTNLGTANFLDFLGQGHYGKTGGYLLIALPNQLIVTAKDKSRVFQQLRVNDGNILLNRFLQGYEGSGVTINSQGQEVLASVKAIPAAGWIILASLPSAEALAPVRSMQQSMFFAAVLLTLIAGLLIQWLLRRQLSPLAEAAAALLERSNTDQAAPPLPITRQDEIGQLLAVFNRLMARLGQREALLKKILDTSSVAIFVVDLQGRITQANQRMEEMFACASGALVGLEYVALLHPDDRGSALQKVEALLAAEIPPVNLDRRYVRLDETRFWGHLTARHFFNAATLENNLVCVIADVTERKNVEQKLLQRENLLSATIENFPGGISMVDADLRLVAYNQQFKRMLDFPESLFEQRELNLEHIFRFNAQRGEYGPGDIEQQVSSRIERAVKFERHKFERERPNGVVLEVHGEPIPGGGFVTAYLDITERKRMEQQVHQLAFFDPLTKLPNRRLLNDRFSQSLAASKRSGNYGALIFLDLDNFKILNDTHGHGAGDLLLIEAAQRLKKCVREVDTVARHGGDEFVLILDDLSAGKQESAAQARIIAEKIGNALALPYQLSVRKEQYENFIIEHQCTASIGVAMFIDAEGTQEDFLRWADAAMYESKAAGCGLIRFFALKN